jgi:hypothetical protein
LRAQGAYGRDAPDAEIHLLNAGHFAMDESVDEIAVLTRQFLDRHHVMEATQSRPK